MKRLRSHFRANQTDEILAFYATGTMPPQLEKLGLVVDLDKSSSANPKDNERVLVRFEE